MSKLDIPESWATANLSEIAAFIRGITFPASAKKSKDTPNVIACFRTSNIQATVEADDLIYVPKDFVRAAKQIVQDRDILMSLANSAELVGKIAQVKIMPFEATFGGFLGCIRGTAINPDFLFYYLRSSSIQEFLRKNAKKTTNIANLSGEAVTGICVPIPPQNEQMRIVSKIESAQAKISEIESFTKRAEELIEKYRETLLQKAFRGELVSQDSKNEPATKLLERIRAERAQQSDGKKKKNDLSLIKPEEIPFEIPKSWEWVRLGSACTKITDGFHNTPKKVANGIPYISAVHVKDESISWDNCDFVNKEDHDELYAKADPKLDDILVVNIGAGCGAAAKINVAYPFSFKNVAILKFDRGLVSADYLLMWLLFRKKKIYEEATSGGCQPFLSLKILNNIIIPLPPMPEQNRIEISIKKNLSFIKATQLSINNSRESIAKLQSSILETAFSGRLVPQNLSEGTGHDLFAQIRTVSERPSEKTKVKELAKRKSK